MRMIWLAALLAFVASPAFAQTPTTLGGDVQTKPSATGDARRPVDTGPNTPEANSAYQGGGMVLQGAPGAPAPKPEGTPPGQTPRNMVPR